MSRPEKNTVEYFPHYISDGKKMFFIEHKYGNDGYSVWFKLLETLASTERHFLNLNSESDLMFLSAKCRVEESVLISILNDLAKLGEINNIAWDNKIVWSDKFIESLGEAYKRRNNKCMNYDSLCIHLSSLGIHLTSIGSVEEVDNTQTKLNNNKLDKTKSNDIKTKEKSRVILPFGSIEFLNSWSLGRTTKKGSISSIIKLFNQNRQQRLS